MKLLKTQLLLVKYSSKKVLIEKHLKINTIIGKNKIPFSYVPVQKLNKLTPHNHQGIVAQTIDIKFYAIEDLLENHQNNGLFVLLDGVTDTRNMGAIIRSAAAVKATAVVIPTNGSAQITGETIKLCWRSFSNSHM